MTQPQSPANVGQYYQIVEEAIQAFGVEPTSCRGTSPGQWNIRFGSVTIMADIWTNQQTNASYFQLVVPVIKVPAANLESFFRELLEINHQLYGVAFTIFKDFAYIKTLREVEGLEQREVLAMLNRAGVYGDDYFRSLSRKYV